VPQVNRVLLEGEAYLRGKERALSNKQVIVATAEQPQLLCSSPQGGNIDSPSRQLRVMFEPVSLLLQVLQKKGCAFQGH